MGATSGAVTVGHLHRTLQILEGAATPEAALEELEREVPSVVDRVRELLERPVTWDALNAVANVARILIELLR
jgi:hypothetical protein